MHEPRSKNASAFLNDVCQGLSSTYEQTHVELDLY